MYRFSIKNWIFQKTILLFRQATLLHADATMQVRMEDAVSPINPAKVSPYAYRDAEWVASGVSWVG